MSRSRTASALLGAVLVIAAAALLFSACRQYMPTNRFLQPRSTGSSMSTADARGKFDHRAHVKPLAARDVTCIDCHRFDVKIDTSNDDLARELSAQALYPGGAACHFCHLPSETHMAGAPDACTTCHENLRPLMPENHQVAWLKVHANAVRADPNQCHTCHSQAFCIDCHERRDSIQTRVHERNFRFFHSVEARANPMQCGSCHRQDFCIRCHQQGKVDVNP